LPDPRVVPREARVHRRAHGHVRQGDRRRLPGRRRRQAAMGRDPRPLRHPDRLAAQGFGAGVRPQRRSALAPPFHGRRRGGLRPGGERAASHGSANAAVSRYAVATLALALLLLGAMAPFVDIDVWHAMSLFREALRQGWIPYTDRFAYTPTISP